jgi:hypothetical protein
MSLSSVESPRYKESIIKKLISDGSTNPCNNCLVNDGNIRMIVHTQNSYGLINRFIRNMHCEFVGKLQKYIIVFSKHSIPTINGKLIVNHPLTHLDKHIKSYESILTEREGHHLYANDTYLFIFDNVDWNSIDKMPEYARFMMRSNIRKCMILILFNITGDVRLRNMMFFLKSPRYIYFANKINKHMVIDTISGYIYTVYQKNINSIESIINDGEIVAVDRNTGTIYHLMLK